jgi:hypothetical protein
MHAREGRRLPRASFRWCCADVYGSLHERWAKRRILLGTRTCLSARDFSIGSNPITPFGRWRLAVRNYSARTSRSTRHQRGRSGQRSLSQSSHREAGSASRSSSGSAARPRHQDSHRYNSESCWHHRALNRGVLMIKIRAALPGRASSRRRLAWALRPQTRHQDE